MAGVLVRMTVANKTALQAKAATRAISVAEPVRRAVSAYDIIEQHEAEELAALLDLFKRLRPTAQFARTFT